MSDEGVISNLRDLMTRVDRQRIWIMTIGVMGIILALIFATSMFTFRVLLPAGLVGRKDLRAIFETSVWLSGACSVISVIAGAKVLFFIQGWHKSYLSLKTAENELEKKYFGSKE